MLTARLANAEAASSCSYSVRVRIRVMPQLISTSQQIKHKVICKWVRIRDRVRSRVGVRVRVRAFLRGARRFE